MIILCLFPSDTVSEESDRSSAELDFHFKKMYTKYVYLDLSFNISYSSGRRKH